MIADTKSFLLVITDLYLSSSIDENGNMGKVGIFMTLTEYLTYLYCISQMGSIGRSGLSTFPAGGNHTGGKPSGQYMWMSV